MTNVRLKFNSLDIRLLMSGLGLGRKLLVSAHPHLIQDLERPDPISRLITREEISRGRLSTSVMLTETIGDWVVDTLNSDALRWYRWGVLVGVEKIDQDFKVTLEVPGA